MKEKFIADVLGEMQSHLDNGQQRVLKDVLEHYLHHYSITEEKTEN